MEMHPGQRIQGKGRAVVDRGRAPSTREGMAVGLEGDRF